MKVYRQQKENDTLWYHSLILEIIKRAISCSFLSAPILVVPSVVFTLHSLLLNSVLRKKKKKSNL
jgi:hydrogenase-4 membrane subunit HyfE